MKVYRVQSWMTGEQQLTELARHVREEVAHQSEVKRRLLMGINIRCASGYIRHRVWSTSCATDLGVCVCVCRTSMADTYKNPLSQNTHSPAWQPGEVPITNIFVAPLFDVSTL